MDEAVIPHYFVVALATEFYTGKTYEKPMSSSEDHLFLPRDLWICLLLKNGNSI